MKIKWNNIIEVLGSKRLFAFILILIVWIVFSACGFDMVTTATSLLMIGGFYIGAESLRASKKKESIKES